ncbi:MAG: hypothetical protein H7Y27_14385 [Gemmatimonadaceae bacterium]|nr:hypothetical protein [Chitinophagaceae bacterium]
MNLFQKLFGSKPVMTASSPPGNHRGSQTFEDRETVLWNFLNETIAYYKSISCYCAFPRFRQMIGIDCTDYRKAFAVSETECLIGISSQFFASQPVSNPGEANSELRTCKNCGSSYLFGWQDFSISVNRSVMKPVRINIEDRGAAALVPIPLFVGPSGHGLPDRTQMIPVPFDVFQKYMRELKPS